MYTYIQSLLSLPPTLLLQPSRSLQSTKLNFLAIQQLPSSCLFYIWQSTRQCYSLNSSILLPTHNYKSIVYVCASIPTLQIGSSITFFLIPYIRTSLVVQPVKCLSTMWETRVRALGWEDPLEKEMAIHSSTIAQKIPWTEEPGRPQSMGLQRVGHD